MALPPIVSPQEWLTARRELLVKEKALTRALDDLAADRRRLPMVRVETDHRFTGPDGELGLGDLFAGRPQLVVQHVMFDPEWDTVCSACTAALSEVSDGLLEHLNARLTTFCAVSRAPYEKIARVARERGWTFPWVSSHGSRFNHDFHVTLDPAAGLTQYNFTDVEAEGELPGYSCFLREGGEVFHTYSTFARGTEQLGGAYAVLDMTVLGRQEDWQEPKDRVEDVRAAVPDFAR